MMLQSEEMEKQRRIINDPNSTPQEKTEAEETPLYPVFED